MKNRLLESGLLLGFLLLIIGFVIRIVYQSGLFGKDNLLYPLLVGVCIFVIGLIGIVAWGRSQRRPE